MHETIIMAYSDTKALGQGGMVFLGLGGLWLLYCLLPNKKRKK